ncbi:hypothetical protein PCE1_003003 [Barthelona sp. PCE]
MFGGEITVETVSKSGKRVKKSYNSLRDARRAEMATSVVRDEDLSEVERKPCPCQARKHPFLCNCLFCGRIHCEREGYGPCLFCGKSLKLEFQSKGETQSETSGKEAAMSFTERLLGYQEAGKTHTKVIDDQHDIVAELSSNLIQGEKREQLEAQLKTEINKKRIFDQFGNEVQLDTGIEIEDD